ncbi:MAG: response regulator transcription factor [Sulfurimonas sp.]|uniref:response regulator transcription factor n=1 Tax=Sulfurimonas sp. TaxID=2022749 RepID=UPI003D0D90BF
MDKEKIKKLRQICRNISVLYVEDDGDISFQVENLLRKIFVKVHVEKNGLQGLKNFNENRQDIVITDISMPIMDGIEMSKRIRLLNSEQNILVTSAHNDLEYLLKLIDIGVDKFILKPIDMNSFLTNISKMAINIYRERREALLESKIKKEKELQVEIFNSIVFPIAYFESDKIVYANDAFRKHFLSAQDLKDLSKFRFGYLFDEKKFIPMSNSEIIKEIEESDEKTYFIFQFDTKVLKKYNINILYLKNSDGYLMNFINLDTLNVQLDRFSKQTDYFPKRETFMQQLLEIKSKNLKEYKIFCIGLKNIKGFIDKFGGKKMHTVYDNLAKHIKKEFAQELQNGHLFVYLFETNRYIMIVEKDFEQAIDAKLENFGKEHIFDYGSSLPLHLSIEKDDLDKRASVKDLLENAEGMLYAL